MEIDPFAAAAKGLEQLQAQQETESLSRSGSERRMLGPVLPPGILVNMPVRSSASFRESSESGSSTPRSVKWAEHVEVSRFNTEGVAERRRSQPLPPSQAKRSHLSRALTGIPDYSDNSS